MCSRRADPVVYFQTFSSSPGKAGTHEAAPCFSPTRAHAPAPARPLSPGTYPFWAWHVMDSCGICPRASGSFHCAKRLHGLPWPECVGASALTAQGTPGSGCPEARLFLTDRHWGCFRLSVTVTNAAMNIRVQVFSVLWSISLGVEFLGHMVIVTFPSS